jgi:long-chain acyl-CoA synthetase
MPKSLWNQWKTLAADQSPTAIAIRTTASTQSWTYAELTAAAEARRTHWHGSPLAMITSRGADFIIDLLAAWAEGVPVCPVENDSPPTWPTPLPTDHGWALLKLTSGSTGTPRGVAFTAEALRADEAQITQMMGLRPEWTHLGAISLAHSYGFSNLVLPLVLSGIPLVLCTSPLPESVRQGLQLAGPCVLPGVPALWRTWFSAGLITPQIRLAISAGAPLPLSLESAIYAQTGLKVHNFLGASECGGIAYDQTETPRTEENYVGSAMPATQLSIDQDSALVVKSTALAATYWPPADEASSSAALTSSNFRTGDLAEISADGVRLLGRASDLMNLAGRKVHPGEIETHLRSHPAIAECVVFSVPSPDPHRYEDMIAGWRAKTDHPVSEKELSQWLAQNFPTWKCPRHWQHWPDLRADLRGKISRHYWKNCYLKNARAAEDSRTT